MPPGFFNSVEGVHMVLVQYFYFLIPDWYSWAAKNYQLQVG